MLFFFILILTNSQNISQVPSYGYPTQYPRYSSLIFLNNKLYTFGGSDNIDLSNEIKSFDFSTSTWSDVLPYSSTSPEPRLNSLSFTYSGSLFIYGGQTKTQLVNDLWKFDLNNQKWKLIETFGEEPSPRVRASLLCQNDSVYLYGGQSLTGFESAVYHLDLNEFYWSLVIEAGHLEAKAGSALFLFNESLAIWGGSSTSMDLALIDIYGNISYKSGSGEFPDYRQSFPFAVFSGFLYLFPGYSYPIGKFIMKCFIISLTTYEAFEVKCGINTVYNSYIQVDHLLFLFGGENFDVFTNELAYVDLNDLNLTLKTITPHTLYPKPRSGHTMMRCRSSLWVFGGCSSGKYFSDSWKFNLISETWEYIPSPAFSPSARCGHKAISIFGDTFLLFGGRNEDEYFNDIFMYNFLSNQWTDLSLSRQISARSGSCIMFEYPVLIVHGGINSKGVLADLWRFNIMNSEYEEVDTVGDPPALYDHNCDTEDEYLVVYSGTNVNGKANPYLYLLDYGTGRWYLAFESELLAISGTKVLNMGDFSLVIGGSKYIEAQSTIILSTVSTAFVIGYLPKAVTSHEMVHAGKTVFIYGGEYTADKIIFKGKGSPLLLKLTMKEFSCSEGYYGPDCEMCPPGTHSYIYNSNSCDPCYPGTSSNDYGLISFTQCLPCEYGTYTDEYGSKLCYDCSTPEDCRFRTIEPRYRKEIPKIVSIQPEPYDDRSSESEEYTSITQLIIGVLIAILFILYLTMKKLKVFTVVDIFKEKHKRKYYEEPFATPFGGLFTLALILLLVLFIVTPLISFFISNITELKTLVPSFTLANNIYTSTYASIKVTFYDYGGFCQNGTECGNTIETSIEGVDFKNVTGPFCNEIELNVCELSYYFDGIFFDKSSSMNLTIIDYSIFAGGIEVELKISTSMPGKYNESLIKFYTESDKNKVYNGMSPSYVYIELIPTLFYSESSEWKDNVTGYHVSSRIDPQPGSMSDWQNCNSYNFLLLALMFEKSENAFVIYRIINVKNMALISGILGSIAGLIGMMGGLMVFSENFITKVKGNIEKKMKLKEINTNRKTIKLDQLEFENEKTNPNENENDAGKTCFIDI